MQTAIVEFFKSYQQAFVTQNSQKIANHYLLPCVMATPDEVKVLTEYEQLITVVDDIVTQLTHAQIITFEISRASFVKLPNNNALVAIHWQFFTNNKQLFTEFCALYTLDMQQSAVKIQQVISHHIESALSLSTDISEHFRSN